MYNNNFLEEAFSFFSDSPNAFKFVGDISYENVVWNDSLIKKPTKKQIEDRVLILKKEFDSKEYQRLRKEEYKKLNQDELRYNDLVNGTNTWQEAIEAIKAKYPKPE
jgi:hypothetical protein